MSKFCSKCGKELAKSSNFCTYCGNRNGNEEINEPINTTVTNEVAVSEQKYNGLSVAGFVVALSSLIINFAGIVGAVGVILSSIGLAQGKKRNQKGFGLALTGIIVGSISILYGIFSVINLINTINYYLF